MFSRFRRSSRSVRFDEAPPTETTYSAADLDPLNDNKIPTPKVPDADLKTIEPIEDAARLQRRPSLARRLSTTFSGLRRKSSSATLRNQTEADEPPASTLYSWGRNDCGQLLRLDDKEVVLDLASGENGDEHTPSPFEVQAVSGNIQIVAPGLFHTVVSTSRGQLWAGGDNEDGQLDKSASATHFLTGKPIQSVDALQDKLPISVAVGNKHTAVATKDGLVLTWGSNESGQLGHTKDTGSTVGPRVLDGNVRKERAVQVVCSEAATFILSEKGQVWSTGECARGELGRPEALSSGCSWMASPILGRMFCTPISMLASGSAHVVALTATGKAYGWGWNRYGQLGLASENQRFESAPIALCESDPIPISWVACGTSHTALVFVDERVLTAGANEHGQLGRKVSGASSLTEGFGEVTALRGNEIVKVNCGAYHTLALSRQGKVYGFGSNEFGEITPKLNARSPDDSAVDIRIDPVECSFGKQNVFVIDIAAGGRSSFALVARDVEDGPKLLQNRLNVKPRIYSLDASLILRLVSEANGTGSFSGLKGALLEFHATGLNRSFVSTSTRSRVDVDGVFRSLEAMWKVLQTKRESDRLISQKLVQLHQELFELAPVASESDQLRAFFIALLNPACDWMTSSVYTILVTAVAHLSDASLDTLAEWCIADLVPDTFTSRLLKPLVRVVDFAAQRRDWSVRGGAPAAIRVLSYLYKHSSAFAGGYVPFDRFYVQQPNQWSNTVIIDEWRRFARRDRTPATRSRTREREFSIFEYPFVLSAETKRHVMMFDQQTLQLQNAVLTALQQAGSPFMEITVRRDHLLEDAFNALLKARRQDLTKPLRVAFEGEPGLDWGGVAKEFFGLLSSFLFDPSERDMFYRPDPDTRPDLMWLNARGNTAKNLRGINEILKQRKERVLRNGKHEERSLQVILADASQCPRKCQANMTPSIMDALHYFCDVCGSNFAIGQVAYSCRTCNYDVCEDCKKEEVPQMTAAYREVAFVGLLMGLAVYHSILLDIHFPLPLFAELLGRPVEATLGNLETVDPALARGLQAMLDMPADDPELFLQTFEGQNFYIEEADFELIENGKNVEVTLENRALYVKRRCEFELREGVADIVNGLISGFRAVVDVDGDAMGLFSPPELELMIVGVPDLDFSALKRPARYEGFTPSTPVVVWFWELCEQELTNEQQRKLLHFLTGSGKAPVGGLAKQVILIQRAGPDSDQLPTAHTCFNTLLLPEYSSKDKLRTKLLVALENSQGFGLQ